jgi:hypothetical protein
MTTRRPGETRDPNAGIEQSLAAAMTGELDMGAFLLRFAHAGLIIPSQTDPAEGGLEPLILAPTGEPRLAVFTARDRAAPFASAAPHSTVMLGRHVLAGLQPGVGLLVNPASGLGFEMEARGVASALGAIAAAGLNEMPDPNIALEQAIVDAQDGVIPPELLLSTFTAGKVYVLSHSGDELAPFTFLKDGEPSVVGVFTRREYAQPFTDGVEYSMFVDVSYLASHMVDGFGIVVNPGSAHPWELGAEIIESLRS